MPLNDFLRSGADVRQDEDRHGAAFQTSGTLQQSFVLRCDSSNKPIRSP